MKTCFLLVLLFSAHLLSAQEKVAPKPNYVIVINDEIVSKEMVDEYAKQGFIKAINKGVSEEERARLAERFGDQIGGKEFIVLISLYTEEEKAEKERKPKEKNSNAPTVIKDSTKEYDEFLLKPNDAAKDFTVHMIDGKALRLSDLKGKVVLVNFWATWCAPCLMEFYDFPSKIIEPFKNREFVLLAIARGESKDKVVAKMQHLKKDGIYFNVGIDPDETIWNRYAKGSIPKNFLIDEKGIIRYASTGYAEENIDKLAKEIKKLLGN